MCLCSNGYYKYLFIKLTVTLTRIPMNLSSAMKLFKSMGDASTLTTQALNTVTATLLVSRFCSSSL